MGIYKWWWETLGAQQHKFLYFYITLNAQNNHLLFILEEHYLNSHNNLRTLKLGKQYCKEQIIKELFVEVDAKKAFDCVDQG